MSSQTPPTSPPATSPLSSSSQTQPLTTSFVGGSAQFGVTTQTSTLPFVSGGSPLSVGGVSSPHLHFTSAMLSPQLNFADPRLFQSQVTFSCLFCFVLFAGLLLSFLLMVICTSLFRFLIFQYRPLLLLFFVPYILRVRLPQ
jgi:hypothetical protein